MAGTSNKSGSKSGGGSADPTELAWLRSLLHSEALILRASDLIWDRLSTIEHIGGGGLGKPARERLSDQLASLGSARSELDAALGMLSRYLRDLNGTITISTRPEPQRSSGSKWSRAQTPHQP